MNGKNKIVNRVSEELRRMRGGEEESREFDQAGGGWPKDEGGDLL